MNVLWARATRTTMLLCYHILHNKRCECGKHAPSEDPAALNTRHMEAPPREKRARAAFFREKDAKRAAKQQRKKDKLTEKISHGGATEKDVAPNVAQRSTYSLELSIKQVEPFAREREQRAGALRPLRILITLPGTSHRDAMVGLSSVAGRATMWQGCKGWLTETEERACFSPTPGVSLGLTGDGTNGLGSSSSEPGYGVCVH